MQRYGDELDHDQRIKDVEDAKRSAAAAQKAREENKKAELIEAPEFLSHAEQHNRRVKNIQRQLLMAKDEGRLYSQKLRKCQEEHPEEHHDHAHAHSGVY